MTDLDFESDQLLVLLTDALHEGPGSPSWHDALGRLRESGVESADELKLLLRVREHLESGRSYRTIRAGDQFTQRLMSTLEAESSQPEPSRNSSIFLVACVAIVLLTAAAIATMVWRSGKSADGDNATGVLINTVASVDFENGLPADWQLIGGLPLTTSRNAVMPDAAKQSQATGGGLAWKTSIGPAEPFSFSANLHLPRGESDGVAELFISDDPTFDATTATTPHEFVWLCQARNGSIISPGGKVLMQQTVAADSRNQLPVRLTLNGARMAVEQAGKLIWAGPHDLDNGKPRTVGIRFLRTGTATSFDAAFSRLRVNMRPATP